MKNDFRTAVVVLFTCIVSACGGGTTPVAPQTVSAPAVTSGGSRGGSWMSPLAAKAQSLLYVTDSAANNVNVYSYDSGKNLRLVGSLEIPEPAGVCTDKAGHVWIASQHGHAVHEFEHGGSKPIFVIKLAQAGIPSGCAVDPSSGDLAIVLNKPHAKFIGHYAAVMLVPNGLSRGPEYTYATGFFSLSFVAFDNKGDLFVDGLKCFQSDYYCYQPSGTPGLFKLARDTTSFTQLTMKGVTLGEPQGIAWIKPTLMVGDNNYGGNQESVGYKLLVRGDEATLVQVVPFKGTYQPYGIAVRAGVAIVPDYSRGAVRTYALSDGARIDTISKGLDGPFAAAVSQAHVKKSSP